VAEQLLDRVDKAVQAAPSPLPALEAMFMAHVGFVIEHPGVPRLLFGELQRAEETGPKRMVQKLILRYEARLRRLIEAGKAHGDLDIHIDTETSAILFIGTIQGLVMKSLLAGDLDSLRHDAARVFAIYHRGIRRSQ